MSQENEVQIVAANFDTKDGAKQALKDIRKAKVAHGNMVMLSKSADVKVKVKENEEWNWGVFKGAFAGAAAGGFALALLGGIFMVGALAGGAIGGPHGSQA